MSTHPFRFYAPGPGPDRFFEVVQPYPVSLVTCAIVTHGQEHPHRDVIVAMSVPRESFLAAADALREATASVSTTAPDPAPAPDPPIQLNVDKVLGFLRIARDSATHQLNTHFQPHSSDRRASVCALLDEIEDLESRIDSLEDSLEVAKVAKTQGDPKDETPELCTYFGCDCRGFYFTPSASTACRSCEHSRFAHRVTFDPDPRAPRCSQPDCNCAGYIA
ncbi:MAG: hypothetical protein EPN91_02215 [Salinibacterium sp.]|nr:MAG: hypothetical protein EPN91_02215 [Salinibacterium sp.]